ncbi:hypothetical protein FI667_g4184, partial [Globisporangium splendens]
MSAPYGSNAASAVAAGSGHTQHQHHRSHHHHVNARWKPAASSHSNANTYRNMILLEKKRKAHEVAVQDMNNALLEETLGALRKKVHDLQADKWMFEDVRI